MTETDQKLLAAVKARPIRVLLVGGYDDMRKEVERNLATLGMRVISHWACEDRKGKHRNAPTGTELVIALKDIASHRLVDQAKEAAKRAKLPYCQTVRKFSVMQQDIFKVALQSKALPAEIRAHAENSLKILAGHNASPVNDDSDPAIAAFPNAPTATEEDRQGLKDAVKTLMDKTSDPWKAYAASTYLRGMHEKSPIWKIGDSKALDLRQDVMAIDGWLEDIEKNYASLQESYSSQGTNMAAETAETKETDMAKNGNQQTQTTPNAPVPTTRAEILAALQRLSAQLIVDHHVSKIVITPEGINISVMETINMPVI